jgi:hypothetical protein
VNKRWSGTLAVALLSMRFDRRQAGHFSRFWRKMAMEFARDRPEPGGMNKGSTKPQRQGRYDGRWLGWVTPLNVIAALTGANGTVQLFTPTFWTVSSHIAIAAGWVDPDIGLQRDHRRASAASTR